MDFGEILRIVRKRWYITLPGVILSIAVTITAFVVVPTSYESKVTLSLINSPRSVTAPGNGNPFLTFDSSLTATADFLARSLMTAEAVRELKGMGVTEEYTAALADNAQGPFITLTVTGTRPGHVQESAAVLADYATKKLRTLQEQSGAPENSMIRVAVIIPPQPADPVIKKKIEIVAGTAGLLFTMTFVITFVTESFLRSRQRSTRLPDGTRLNLGDAMEYSTGIHIARPRTSSELASRLAGASRSSGESARSDGGRSAAAHSADPARTSDADQTSVLDLTGAVDRSAAAAKELKYSQVYRSVAATRTGADAETSTES
jgi:capsular polysaccharide biosynthesis protein